MESMNPAIAAPVAAPVQPTKKRKILRYTLFGLLGLSVLLLVAHFVWVASGSNDWRLVRDQDGVKVWTLKTPGDGHVRVRATVRVKSKMAGMVKLLEDLDSCVDAYCYDTKRLAQIPSVDGRAATYVRFKFDIPGLKTREYVLFAEHYQDPASKVMDINIVAAPSMMPRDECCVRVTHLHNRWKLTPQPNQELDIEFWQDTDLGGMPYVFSNLALTEGTLEIMRDMQNILNKERYRAAQVDYVKEFGQS